MAYEDDDSFERETGNLDFGESFADPGGRSALRAGARTLPCPTCKQPNRLTQRDRELSYQCDSCADSLEGYGP